MKETNQKWNGIGIIGFGELGRQIAMLAAELYPGQKLVVFDDQISSSDVAVGVERFKFNQYSDSAHGGLGFFVGLGYKHLALKRLIITSLISSGRFVPSLVHPSSFVHKTAKIGPGVVIYPMSNVDKEVTISMGVLLNNSVVVSHNSTIGSCSYLSPGTVLSGNVSIGSECFVGAGTVVANSVNIGDESVIGVGSVVAKNLGAGTHAIGNPLRILEKKIKLA